MAKLIELPLAEGGYISVNPDKIGDAEEIKAPGIFTDGKTRITLGEKSYEIAKGLETVKSKLEK